MDMTSKEGCDFEDFIKFNGGLAELEIWFRGRRFDNFKGYLLLLSFFLTDFEFH